MKKIIYSPRGVCSKQMEVEIGNSGKIEKVKIIGGCAGNTQGIARLVEGMDAREAIEKIKGIRCGFKASSCPNELSKAIAECLEN